MIFAAGFRSPSCKLLFGVDIFYSILLFNVLLLLCECNVVVLCRRGDSVIVSLKEVYCIIYVSTAGWFECSATLASPFRAFQHE